MVRPSAIDRELTLLTAEIDPKVIARELAALARKSLSEAQARGEASKNYKVFVNGREGVSLDSVIPPGPIIFEFNQFEEVVSYAVAFWRARAPKRSGRYANSVVVLANGKRTRDYSSIPDDAEVVILATVPYTRKIEVGAMKMNVPPGIAEDTRQAVMRRFGNMFSVMRKFVYLEGGYVLKTGRRRGEPLTYPAVVINSRF